MSHKSGCTIHKQQEVDSLRAGRTGKHGQTLVKEHLLSNLSHSDIFPPGPVETRNYNAWNVIGESPPHHAPWCLTKLLPNLIRSREKILLER